VIEIAHDMSNALKNTNVHKNCLGSKGSNIGQSALKRLNNHERQLDNVTVFFLSGKNLHPGPMHDSKFWKECHLLAPIVGFSHS
jgi:hypothetical protein